MNIFNAPIILGSMLLLNAPILWNWALEYTMLLFVAILAASLLGIKLLTMWDPKPAVKSGQNPPVN